MDTKSSLLFDHLQKMQKLHVTKISAYAVVVVYPYSCIYVAMWLVIFEPFDLHTVLTSKAMAVLLNCCY